MCDGDPNDKEGPVGNSGVDLETGAEVAIKVYKLATKQVGLPLNPKPFTLQCRLVLAR